MKIFKMEITEKKKTLTALLLTCTLLVSVACDFNSVASRIESVLQEAMPAVQLVVSLLPLLGTNLPPQIAPAVAAWAPRVEDDVAQVQAEYNSIKKDLANNPDGKAKLNTLIADAQRDVLSILPVFRVLDSEKQKRIENVVNALAAIIQSAENMILTAEGKTSLKRVSGSGMKLSFSKKDVKKNFNEVLKANFPDAAGLK